MELFFVGAAVAAVAIGLIAGGLKFAAWRDKVDIAMTYIDDPMFGNSTLHRKICEMPRADLLHALLKRVEELEKKCTD